MVLITFDLKKDPMTESLGPKNPDAIIRDDHGNLSAEIQGERLVSGA